MTLTLRKSLLGCLLLPAVIGSLACSAIWFGWLNDMFPDFTVPPGRTSLWWLILRPAVQNDLPWALAGISFLCFFPLVSELFLGKCFGRSDSPEIFFIRFSILSLPLQAARLLVLFAGLDFLPWWWAGIGMRVAWFGRLLGIVSLLGIAIFSGAISFRKAGLFLTFGTLAAISISIIMPLDSSQPFGNLMVRTSASTPLALICILTQILAFSGLTGNVYLRQIPRYYSLALYVLLIILGMDMAFFTSQPLITVSTLLLISGLTGFYREIKKIYQQV